MNTISERKKYKVSLYSKCPIYGILKVNKKNHGYLKYYDGKKEITDLTSYNKYIIQNIINQAQVILSLRYGVLWSY
jgi:hypothetical protein